LCWSTIRRERYEIGYLTELFSLPFSDPCLIFPCATDVGDDDFAANANLLLKASDYGGSDIPRNLQSLRWPEKVTKPRKRDSLF